MRVAQFGIGSRDGAMSGPKRSASGVIALRAYPAIPLPEGEAVCPATYSDATCKTCGACARVRDAVIGFPAHGAWRQVEAATAARDIAVGAPWTFSEHRTMAQVIAEEVTAA